MASNKTTTVYSLLKERIITGELHPGLPINEADFARAFSVSKTPVREALRELERDGLVQYVPGRGSAVSTINPQDIHEVLEIREIIEVGAAKRAALQHGSDELRAKLAECEELLREESGQDVAQAWGSREDVHLSIVSSVGNQALVKMYVGLLDRIRRIRDCYGARFTARRFHEILGEHTAMLAAIVNGNPVAAEKATQCHIRNASAFLDGLVVPEGR